MKNLRHLFVCAGAALALLTSQASWAQQPAQPYQSNQGFKVGVVNSKKCLEDSKLGKQDTADFKKMQAQMETILQEKVRALEEIESKLSDDDYIDSITPEAEASLKQKKRELRKEAVGLESQYMQTLQQANVKIVQKLTDVISKASEQVAQEMGLDYILTDEACTFYNKNLDVSDRIVAKMDQIYATDTAKDAQKK